MEEGIWEVWVFVRGRLRGLCLKRVVRVVLFVFGGLRRRMEGRVV